MEKMVIGIDIGGTFTKYGFVSQHGEMFHEGSLETDKHDRVEDYIEELCSILHRVKDENNIDVAGIGVGAPNGNYYTGAIENAPNLRWKGYIDLVSLFSKHFNIPVVVTNDANAAAHGELIYGNGKGMKHFIMITLGTGLGSGFVVDGKVVYGHDGFAGELGHTTAIPGGRECGCGKRGCLETYVSAPGIKKTLFELFVNDLGPSDLRSFSFDELDARMITDAAKTGDPIALKAFDYTGRILGMKLADAVAHTSPEAFFLFGGLALAGDMIFAPAKKYMEEYLLSNFRNKVKILPSALINKNVAILGAGALSWDEIKSGH